MSESKRLDWHEARRRSLLARPEPRLEVVSLAAAHGRTLAGDVIALCEIPHYSSSAMDGWAVAGESPWKVVRGDELAPGECAPIVTGGLVPRGAAAVLRSESAIVSDAGVVSVAPTARADEPRPGEHIRKSGEEASRGEVVVVAGTVLNPAHVALAASAGHDELTVRARLRARLLFTGDEVVLGGIPPAGFVRDSFGPVLPSIVEALGAQVVSSQRVPDTWEAMRAALTSDAGSSDILITTGGTGDSSADHLRRTLRELDAEFLIDGVRMRPGGPSLLARLPDGRLLVGLPGNPMAAIIALLAIGGPLIAGTSALGTVRVGVEVGGREATTLLIPYVFESGGAKPVGWSGSGMMRGMAQAVAILVCPPEGLMVGDTAQVLALPWA
jgi:molybdopterin molybdotransferase